VLSLNFFLNIILNDRQTSRLPILPHYKNLWVLTLYNLFKYLGVEKLLKLRAEFINHYLETIYYEHKN